MRSRDPWLSDLRSPPIFQIGFNKCGTTSLHRFLIRSRIRSAHWERGRLAKCIMARMEAGEDPIADFPTTIGFTDMICLEPGLLIEPYKHFDYLHHWYPTAIFILNTRDRENWIASRSSHQFGDLGLLSRYAECFGIPEASVPDFWRAEWETHHRRARAYFDFSPNFLEFNIERDDPETLRSFMARRFPQCAKTPFGMHNRRPNGSNELPDQN
jgi:hypothetical protein